MCSEQQPWLEVVLGSAPQTLMRFSRQLHYFVTTPPQNGAISSEGVGSGSCEEHFSYATTPSFPEEQSLSRFVFSLELPPNKNQGSPLISSSSSLEKLKSQGPGCSKKPSPKKPEKPVAQNGGPLRGRLEARKAARTASWKPCAHKFAPPKSSRRPRLPRLS